MAQSEVSVHIMNLGGGLIVDGENVQLSSASVARTERTLKYYKDNERRFSSTTDEPFILCTGGFPGYHEGMASPPKNSREGRQAADYLLLQGVPLDILRVEDGSWSTGSNFANSAAQGLLRLSDFTMHRPLGVVTHPAHMRRARRIAELAGVGPGGVLELPVAERDGFLLEGVLYAATVLGARSLEDVLRREHLVAKALGRTASEG